MRFQEHKFGNYWLEQSFVVFMGNRHSSTSAFKEAFPKLNFFRLKQIHSDLVHHVDMNSPDLKLEGDASITISKNFALCSITADCIPVFIIDRASSVCAAIHAGWRGVANRIVPKTLKVLESLGIKNSNCRIFVGPHIQQSSFEVGTDVMEKILSSLQHPQDEFVRPGLPGKHFVDLNGVLRTQVREFVSDSYVTCFNANTFDDKNFHSFRRDRETAGRQVSFCSLLTSKEPFL